MIDSIGMGCIPVLISDYTVYPFQHILDYSKFALFLRESELPLLEEWLDSIPLQRLEEMQMALKIVRNSFLYKSPHLLKRYGPVDLSLRALVLQRNVWDPIAYLNGSYAIEGKLVPVFPEEETKDE